MNFDFELILFWAVVITGIITLADKLYFEKKRKALYAISNKDIANPPELKTPIIIDYAKSFFPILVIVFLLRSFLYEPFRIPTGSLEPSLHIGDFVLVNKYDYGIRLPVIHKKVIGTKGPQRGDIFVFRYPADPKLNFIKRVIGLPGDRISYIDKILYINGKEVPQKTIKLDVYKDENGRQQDVIIKEETIENTKHLIYQRPEISPENFTDVIVPEGTYFAMGDNRDDSADSRMWGPVPDQNILGKAVLVWLSWDSEKNNLRWNRFFTIINRERDHA